MAKMLLPRRDACILAADALLVLATSKASVLFSGVDMPHNYALALRSTTRPKGFPREKWKLVVEYRLTGKMPPDILQSRGWKSMEVPDRSTLPPLAEQLRALPYLEYLKTPHWASVRKRCLVYYEYRCALCYSESLLNCHHRTYLRMGCERPSDVICLCRDCHEKHHGIKEN